MEKHTREERAKKVPIIVDVLVSLPNGTHFYTLDELMAKMNHDTLTKTFVSLTMNKLGRGYWLVRRSRNKQKGYDILMGDNVRPILRREAEQYINGTLPFA